MDSTNLIFYLIGSIVGWIIFYNVKKAAVIAHNSINTNVSGNFTETA